MMFRDLTKEEKQEFRDYALSHDPEPGKWAIYHPVCREVWIGRGFGPPKEVDQG